MAQQSTAAVQTESSPSPPAQVKDAAPSSTVKVRVKHGRLLVGRIPAKFGPQGNQIEESQGERYAEEGEIVEVDRRWAEKLMARQFDGYPSRFANGAPGQEPGTIRDCPIEIVH